MNDEENGSRKETLLATMTEITKVYDLANPQGILSIRFLNTLKGKRNANKEKAVALLKGHSYWGSTKIGTVLDKKVLQRFVWGPDPLKKPLLVMTITDGDVCFQSNSSPLCYSKR